MTARDPRPMKEWQLHEDVAGHPAVRRLFTHARTEDLRFLTQIFSRTTLTDDGCIQWRGAWKANGYGVASSRSTKGIYVHRFVCGAGGHDIKGLCVCHSCDNPPCINPDHLWVGSARDNHRDAMAKGRAKKPPVTDWPATMRQRPHHWQKLNIEDIPEIRRRLASGETQKSIGERFGVAANTIWNIKAGVRWAHVR